jgi:uroporphyrinogen-III decarboxylase
MNHVERFRAVMGFQPVDRLPRWEWAMWWDQTIANWKRQGLPAELESVFDEFIAPCYRRIVPRLAEMGVPAIVDTDGDVTRLVPWLAREGIRGVLPLERQAGVDGMALRRQYPRFCLIGHFDKMVMSRGEPAIRAEFERLLPLMRSGGFIPSVVHQTPPHVTIDQYRMYLRLLRQHTTGR